MFRYYFHLTIATIPVSQSYMHAISGIVCAWHILIHPQNNTAMIVYQVSVHVYNFTMLFFILTAKEFPRTLFSTLYETQKITSKWVLLCARAKTLSLTLTRFRTVASNFLLVEGNGVDLRNANWNIINLSGKPMRRSFHFSNFADWLLEFVEYWLLKLY